MYCCIFDQSIKAREIVVYQCWSKDITKALNGFHLSRACETMCHLHGSDLCVPSKSNICDAGKSKTLQQNRISPTALTSSWLSEIILGCNVRKKVPCSQILNYCLIINFLANSHHQFLHFWSDFTDVSENDFHFIKTIACLLLFFLWKQMQIQNWIFNFLMSILFATAIQWNNNFTFMVISLFQFNITSISCVDVWFLTFW